MFCIFRVLLVPILQRHVRVDGGNPPLPHSALFGHPTIVQVPSDIRGGALYECVESVAPVDGSFEIVLTEAQGLTCSRCAYEKKCDGCVISRDDFEVKLQPRDCLTLNYFSKTLK